MSIPIFPQSQFNGEIFVSNFHDVHDLCKPPSVRLNPSHPFHQLWHSHLQSLSQTGGLFEGVIDCLAAILLGDPCWKETTPTAVSQTRSDICSLLIRTPPNVIILSSLDDYACHVQCSALWNYVCISNFYVKLWMDSTNKPKHKIGLAALLITSMDHEIAHWAQSIKNGLCYLPTSSHISDITTTSDLGPDDDDDSADASSPVPLFHGENPLLADTPKAFQAPWMPGPTGEAGDFLEISTRGGIMEYDFRHRRVYLVVGEDDFRVPTKPYLDLYERNEGPSTSLVFRPATQKDAHARFPLDGVDGCPPTRGSYGRNRHHVPTKVLKL